MDDQEETVREALNEIENLSKGIDAPEVMAPAMEGLKVVYAEKGLIRSTFLITNGVSDQHGNWHIGAMITLMDILVGFTTYTSNGLQNVVTVSLNVSRYSPARIQEEVEIESKAVAEKAKITSVVVEIRKTENGQLIALGRQWMASSKY